MSPLSASLSTSYQMVFVSSLISVIFAGAVVWFTYIRLIEITWFCGIAIIALGWWYRDRMVEKKAATATKEAAG